MQRDYYAFRRAELNDSLNALEQVAEALAEARNQNDKEARKQAESQMQGVAGSVVEIEPHLAYLWFWAKKEDAEQKEEEETKKRFSEVATAIRGAWQNRLKTKALPSEFHLIPDVAAISNMPPLSFILHIPFRLQSPYLSKDERDFYLLDNPLRKEKVFQTPMVAATSWKGALRAALWQLGYKEDNEITIRLFGNPRGGDEHQAGRLYFYPTFFDRIELEVINPHDRETGVGARGPILMECVPQEAKGDLFLLYVPFGPIGQSEDERRAGVAKDLQVLAEGIRMMLTTYGFGAKTSSGFGTVKDQLVGEGKLVIRAKLIDEAVPSETAPELQQPKLPRYLETPTRLRADLRREDGSLKSEAEYRAWIESQGRKYGKKDKQLYEKAQKWWEREGKQLMEAGHQESKTESEPAPTETPPIAEFTLHTLSELPDLAQRVAVQLQKGGEE